MADLQCQFCDKEGRCVPDKRYCPVRNNDSLCHSYERLVDAEDAKQPKCTRCGEANYNKDKDICTGCHIDDLRSGTTHIQVGPHVWMPRQ